MSRPTPAFVLTVALLSGSLAADDVQKKQKKELETAAKDLIKTAKSLEHSGELVQARLKYAESLGYLELKDSLQGIKHLDDKLVSKAKAALQSAQKLYDSRKFQQAAQVLETALALETLKPLLSYNLALCYHGLGDRQKAADYLDQAIASAGTPKLRSRLSQMRTVFTTAETPGSLNGNVKKQVANFDRLAETVGNGIGLKDELGDEETPPASGDAAEVPAAPERTSVKAFSATDKPRGDKVRFSSACTALQGMKDSTANSAAATFNLANCAEDNNRPEEAVRLLHRYLEMSPKSLDSARVAERIAELEVLRALPDKTGYETRTLYASASRSIGERQYDRALADYTAAAGLVPDFTLTHWRLGLLQEAMGNVAEARKEYTRFRELSTETGAQQRADFHLGILDEKRKKYDEEVSEAEDAISDLLNRAMNLTFNGLESHSAQRARRQRTKDKKQLRKPGGFAVPMPYAQQQLSLAGRHLLAALSLFPLGVEANELMALVYLQAFDGRAALRSYDAVASQNMPVSFYAELRGSHNLDRPVKCELTRDNIRFIYLASYGKKGFPTPPAQAAGEDGLGDLIVSAPRAAAFEEFVIKLADIKKVEAKKCQISIKLQKEEYTLAPLFLPYYPPAEGPLARRFSNDYTRLFVRYPGLEDAKLGAEGLTGGEKFKLGMDLATNALSIATGGFDAIAIIQDVITVVQKVRMLQRTLSSLHITFAAWETSVNEEQDVLVGNPFKLIPAEPIRLAYLQELK